MSEPAAGIDAEIDFCVLPLPATRVKSFTPGVAVSGVTYAFAFTPPASRVTVNGPGDAE